MDLQFTVHRVYRLRARVLAACQIRRRLGRPQAPARSAAAGGIVAVLVAEWLET